MASDEVIISLKNVCKNFKTFAAVSDFNLEIKKGQFVTLLGPSGCGKTTTLRMIGGFEIPTSGEILLDGKNITNLPPYKRPINTVFQKYALFPHMDVYDNVAFGLKLKKIEKTFTDKKGNTKVKKVHLSPEEIDERVSDALKTVDLEELEDRDITTLSGGQQQRVAIARCIVNQPEILLLDEPLGALDLKMRKDMQIELKEMHKNLGITFIYVTHDQEEALTMSDVIVVMKDGIMQQVGTPTEIYNEPINAFVADFIGESNIYNGTMMDAKNVKILNSKFKCVDNFPVNERVDVVIRPEDVVIGEPGKGTVDGIITTKVFKGVHYEYVIKVGKNEVLAKSTREYKLEKPVSISVKPTNIHIMKKLVSTNIFTNFELTNKNTVEIGDGQLELDVSKLIPNSKIDDSGYVITKNGKKYDFNGLKVNFEVEFDKPVFSDDTEFGQFTGEIISSIWKGDHYQVVANTSDDEDIIIDTQDTWNIGDKVGIKIDKKDIKLIAKGDLTKYEI